MNILSNNKWQKYSEVNVVNKGMIAGVVAQNIPHRNIPGYYLASLD